MKNKEKAKMSGICRDCKNIITSVGMPGINCDKPCVGGVLFELREERIDTTEVNGGTAYINTGGSAFPVVGPDGPYGAGDTVTIGMSLRDYFAAYASDKDIDEILKSNHGERMLKNSHVRSITRQDARYIHADAMLKAREN